MNYTLVVAEKPAVGMSIAAVLGAKKRENGYMEGNGYIVSWCLGHFGEFAEANAYDERYEKWRVEDLPVLPDPWRYKVSRDKHTQYEALKKLFHRADVSIVVNACDAGREGERIFRSAYTLAGCDKPVKRLWISSMEDDAIRKGFDDLRPGTDYDLLYAAADCRAKADWLVGINATRLYSVLYHRTLNVGRVVSPTLALIVQREAEISAFQPEPFYTVELVLEDFTAVSERFTDKDKAQSALVACDAQAVVKTATAKDRSEKAPALYDLTALQRDANRLLGYTAQQTLDYAQSLYEKKLCTYPRTDARFLTDDMEGTVATLAASAAAILGVDAPETVNAAQVCNSKKVSDHHAIVPTASAAKADLAALPAGEREVLRLIARQLLCAVGEAHRFREISVTVVCGGTEFSAKGKTVLAPGWKRYLQQETEDKALPALEEGQSIPVTVAEMREGKTAPPKHFTEDSLLSAMETAGAKETPDDAERKGLGTPATRAGIIEKLVSSGFVQRKRAKKAVYLIPAQIGVNLITVLPEQLQSPLLTAEWEHRLKDVERGELAPDAFLAEITDMVTELMRTGKAIPGAEVLFPSGRKVIGKCPRCGSDVTESKKGFFCERNDCRFGLWLDNKFLTGKKITLTEEMAAALLRDGRVPVRGIYSEKTGKTYDADILLEDTGEFVRYRLDFSGGGAK